MNDEERGRRECVEEVSDWHSGTEARTGGTPVPPSDTGGTPVPPSEEEWLGYTAWEWALIVIAFCAGAVFWAYWPW